LKSAFNLKIGGVLKSVSDTILKIDKKNISLNEIIHPQPFNPNFSNTTVFVSRLPNETHTNKLNEIKQLNMLGSDVNAKHFLNHIFNNN
jgi:hypothetical protein